MLKLKTIPLIKNDVFYRGYHVLDYIKLHPNMDELDKEALINTILDSLVSKEIINPNKQSLNIDNLCIEDNLDYYKYQEQPFVTSIPITLKELYRNICIQISGGIPSSLALAKPASQVHFCIYDMNTIFSSIFDDFSFLVCDYDSPTRKGSIAIDRPFIMINYHNESYLVDTLTKRMFKAKEFIKRYNMVIKNEIKKSNFNKEQQQLYKEQTSSSNNITFLITFVSPMIDNMKNNPNMAEYVYEYEKVLEIYKEDVKEANQILKTIKNM